MAVWTVIALVGAVLGIIGMFVANWAEHHPRYRRGDSTRPHDIAFVIGMIGWAIGLLGFIATLIDGLWQ